MRVARWVTASWKWFLSLALLLGVSIVAFATKDRWLPIANRWLDNITRESVLRRSTIKAMPTTSPDENVIDLSTIEQRNIGLRSDKVQLNNYIKTTSIPAIITERPGKTQFEVTAHFTGTVTAVHVVIGQVVEPGQALF